MLTLEKLIFPPFLLGLEPATFLSRVCRSTTELSPLPKWHSFDITVTIYCPVKRKFTLRHINVTCKMDEIQFNYIIIQRKTKIYYKQRV